VIPEVETCQMAGKSVVVIRLKEHPLKPVSVKGKCFRRVGKSNRLMTSREIAVMHYQSTDTSWDKLPARDAELEDLDPDKVKKFIAKANETGRRKISGDEKPLQVLDKMELIKEGKPTWAAFLLFRGEEKRFHTQSALHCGRFKEETVVIDDRMIEETLIEQIDEAMDFIRKNTNVKFLMRGKPEREQVWDYPLDALREALINAVCHRDYTMPSNAEVRIYDEELTIWNPGGLPPGITIEDLYKPHRSILRNKGIGAVFYDMGLIEQWGSGIGKMRYLCEQAGLPEPLFEEYQRGFQVTFRQDVYTEEYLRSLDLNDRQIKVVMYVKEKGKITNTEYQDLLSASKRTASNDLKELVENNLLEKIGTRGRGTFYKLKGH
jgi:ATP-dependent DNA helicase RecG